jgi:hypothetical protein
MQQSKAHSIALFVHESHTLVMPVGSSRDKAYGLIRCEAKLASGAPDVGCSRKGVVE